MPFKNSAILFSIFYIWKVHSNFICHLILIFSFNWFCWELSAIFLMDVLYLVQFLRWTWPNEAKNYYFRSITFCMHFFHLIPFEKFIRTVVLAFKISEIWEEQQTNAQFFILSPIIMNQFFSISKPWLNTNVRDTGSGKPLVLLVSMLNSLDTMQVGFTCTCIISGKVLEYNLCDKNYQCASQWSTI